jgi:hypothetical protein
MPCSPVEVHWCSGGTCYLRFQQEASRVLFLPGFLIDIFFNPEGGGGNRFRQRAKLCLVGFIHGFFFNPEDRGNMFIRNWWTATRLHCVTYQ